MSEVLIDNLSIKRMLQMVNNPSKDYKSDIHIQNYLNALVLWDDIFAIRDTNYRMYQYIRGTSRWMESSNWYSSKWYSGSWDKKIEEKMLDITARKLQIKRIPIMDEDTYIQLAFRIAHEWYKNKDIISYGFNLRTINDAIFYLLLGCNLDKNVLLSSERANFANQSGIIDKIFSRVDIMNLFNSDVMNYYSEINKSLGKNIFKLENPLLIEYVCSSSTNLKDAISIALQLRKEKNVIAFRKAMDAIDIALNTGNIVEFNQYIKDISEIVNQITKLESNIKSAEINVSITPAITVPIKIPIRIPRKSFSKKINLNFLYQLAEYGLRGKDIR